MISIKYSQIPGFLCNGSFFRSLSEEETSDELQIPERCYSSHDNAHNAADFVKLMEVTAFWGLNEIPQGLIVFCNNADSMVLDELIGEKFAVLDFAQVLRNIFVPASPTVSHRPLVNAIVIGRSEVFNYLVRDNVGGVEAALSAVEHGRLDYLKLLHLHGHPWDETVCIQAAAGGFIECLQYLHENGCPWNDKVVLSAAKKSHFNCMKYAHEQGVRWHYDTMTELCEIGNFEMLKYALENGCLVDDICIYDVADKGDVDCLRYLLELQLESATAFDEVQTMEAVIRGGHLNCLLLLEELHIQVDWDEDWFSDAVKYGDLDLVKHLHEIGCPWDEHASYNAVVRGHLDMLRYLVEQGCENFDFINVEAARLVSEGGLQCLQSLIEQRGVKEKHDGQLFLEVLSYGNYFVLPYLLTKEPGYLTLSIAQRKDLGGRLQSHLHYRPRLKHDQNISTCIEELQNCGWNMTADLPEIVDFVLSNSDRLPLCVKLLK